MNIPDKAIRAAYGASGAHHLTLDDMKAALESAAPFIAAQALRDAALALDRGYSAAYHHGEGDINIWRKLHGASYWLRDRADAEEQ